MKRLCDDIRPAEKKKYSAIFFLRQKKKLVHYTRRYEAYVVSRNITENGGSLLLRSKIHLQWDYRIYSREIIGKISAQFYQMKSRASNAHCPWGLVEYHVTDFIQLEHVFDFYSHLSCSRGSVNDWLAAFFLEKRSSLIWMEVYFWALFRSLSLIIRLSHIICSAISHLTRFAAGIYFLGPQWTSHFRLIEEIEVNLSTRYLRSSSFCAIPHER